MSFDALGSTDTRARSQEQRARESSAVERLLASLDGMDPFERIEALRQAGRRKAEAEGRAYQMDHTRKALLSRLATEIAAAHPKQSISEAKLERLARADPRYQTHLDGTAEAMREREEATAAYYTIRAELEWMRAAVAHENALSRIEG